MAADSGCGSLPNQAALKTALDAAVLTESSGLDLQMWATIVDRDGIVCAVAFSGADRGAQWPEAGSSRRRKPTRANAFSLDKLALSTANLYSAVQPGGSLYGLQASNPVNTSVAYKGPSKKLWPAQRSDGGREDRRRECVRRRFGAVCGRREDRRRRRRQRGYFVCRSHDRMARAQ